MADDENPICVCGNEEVAAVVLAVIQLPPNVALRDALITSVDYQ